MDFCEWNTSPIKNFKLLLFLKHISFLKKNFVRYLQCSPDHGNMLLYHINVSHTNPVQLVIKISLYCLVYRIKVSLNIVILFLQGFGVTWARTMGLMTTYFILVDSGRRHFPEQFKRPLLGPFLASGIAATYPLRQL